MGAEVSPLATQTLAGMALGALGDAPGALERLREGLEIARRVGLRYLLGYTGLPLALVLAEGAEESWRDEAEALALEGLEGTHNLLHEGMAHLVLAKLAARRHRVTEAEARMGEVFQMLALFPPYLLFARRDFVTFLLAQGRAEEARRVAMLGVEELERMGGAGVHAVPMYLGLAESCFAQGDGTAGERALREAVRAVRARAGDLSEPEARERFLSHVPENARTLELARQRWGEDAASMSPGRAGAAPG